MDSMFDEFKNVVEEFQSKKEDERKPAMIILERKITGENKHAIIGEPYDIITLFEWGINSVIEGYEIDFDKFLQLIKMKHDDTDHIFLNNLKKEL